MKIYKRCLILGLFFVLIGASVSMNATGKTSNINSGIQKSSIPGAGWSDDFSSYTLGQFLDGDPTDGGWKGWNNDPAFGAYVVDTQELSKPHSVEIAGDSDLIHEFNGYIIGQWTFIAWQYIPSDFEGESGFMLLNTYSDGGTNSWSTQLRFNSVTGVVTSDNDGNELPLAYDQWVEIRVEIDLDADIQDIFYDGDLLVSKSWKDGVTGGGIANIGSVDLFANLASPVYYDDISLSGDTPLPSVCCQGDLSWSNVGAGKKLSGTLQVSNCGDDGSELDWEVSNWPEWGSEWTFTPASGTGLTTAQGWIDVQVEFNAPNEKNMEYDGAIELMNSNNPANTCEVSIYVLTPKNKQYDNNPFINFLKNHQNMFPILQWIVKGLGLY